MSAIVIGGGFSGAMTAAHLAARGIATVVIEPSELGRGVAYSRHATTLLLNTPAAMMSALGDQPAHFVDWLANRGSSAMFAPRAAYGEYVTETATALGGAELHQLATRATTIEESRTGYTVACENGQRYAAHTVVLALGNPPPRTPRAIDPASPSYLADPYAAIGTIAPDEPVALLGTGLTALDVIVGLRARGHHGSIYAGSRRGLVPLAHDLQPREAVMVPRELIRQPRLHRITAWWKMRRMYGVSDASIVAALRPHIPLLWKRLPGCDRVRFLRHVRPRWDVTRHRAPPVVRAVVDVAIADGSLEIAGARLAATEQHGDRLRCTFANATHTITRDVRWFINCTGPERDVRAQTSPLVRSLLARGLIEADPLGIGVATDDDGRIANGLYAVGPWRAADLWESTAVPELRVQAAATATAIANEHAALRAAV